jgi:hypothetical protein
MAWMSLMFLLSACVVGDASFESAHGLSGTIKDVYQGVKGGNVVDVPLRNGDAYVTVETCIENSSEIEQVIHLQDVFIIADDGSQFFPVALGYDQAEAFSWALPMLEPIGGKRFPHEYYFFLIQSNELMKIPAYQSLGCDTSLQFKSLAFLFIVPDEIVDQPYTLHFLDGEMNFKAKRISPVSGYLKWGVGGVLLLALAVVLIIVVIKKRSKTQTPTSQEQSQDDR